MRLTQGTFSFLPDLTDVQIRAQVEYCLGHGWAVSVEHTDDPHPRNTYWEMFGLPMFDIHDAAGVMGEIDAARASLRLHARNRVREALVHREPTRARAGLRPRPRGGGGPDDSLPDQVLRGGPA